MKNIFSIIMLFIMITACSVTDEEPRNPASEYLNTKWQAPDEIAQLIWGGNNVQQLEFISLTEVQEIRLRNGSVRSTAMGTYSITGNTVKVTIGDRSFDLQRSGSLLISDRKLLSGGFLTYQKM